MSSKPLQFNVESTTQHSQTIRCPIQDSATVVLVFPAAMSARSVRLVSYYYIVEIAYRQLNLNGRLFPIDSRLRRIVARSAERPARTVGHCCYQC